MHLLRERSRLMYMVELAQSLKVSSLGSRCLRRVLQMTAMITTALLAWATLSAQTDIEYAKVGGLSLRLDAHPAAGETSAPAVILVHGGAWVKGDRHNVEPLILPLTQSGVAAFNITYRFAPDYLYPAAVEDVQEAVRFVRHHATRFHVDPDRIALLGESAGAQLASLAALDALPDTKVQAVVSLYGPTDFVRLARTSSAVPDVFAERPSIAVAGTG